jgi:NAD-dependent deacetylase
VDDFERAARALAVARKVVVVSGAGISAESGIATFRDTGGLWEQHAIEDVATPEALQRNPRKVWEFYERRREHVQSVAPNAGHAAVAELETVFEEVVTITQNVDGLHQRAGSSRVIEVHGSLWRARCLSACGAVVDPFPFPASELPPRCACGGMLRPAVVLFGELLPAETFALATRHAGEADVCLVVGTSGSVWPAAGLPLAARDAGASTVEVNPEPTELTAELDWSLRGTSGSLLPRLVYRARELRA